MLEGSPDHRQSPTGEGAHPATPAAEQRFACRIFPLDVGERCGMARVRRRSSSVQSPRRTGALIAAEEDVRTYEVRDVGAVVSKIIFLSFVERPSALCLVQRRQYVLRAWRRYILDSDRIYCRLLAQQQNLQRFRISSNPKLTGSIRPICRQASFTYLRPRVRRRRLRPAVSSQVLAFLA
jgi:hypothetical protein